MYSYVRTKDGRVFPKDALGNVGELDINALISTVTGGGGGQSTDSGNQTGGTKVDSEGLGKGLSQFALGAVQDFAKREQDNYNKPDVRDQKDSDAVTMGKTVGAVAGAAICAATGVGAALLPLCGLVGGFIGGLVGGLFSEPTLSPEGQKIWDKYFGPAGYEKNGHEYGKAEAVARVWSAYGFDTMDGVVALIRCAKQKNVLHGDTYPEQRDKTIYWWIPFDDRRHDALIANELGDWAHKNKGRASIDSDVDGIFKWQLQMLYGMMNRDKRCLDEANKNTMRAFGLIKMFDSGIYTPQAVRQYTAYYDDGQKESHKQILDPCSPFSEAYDRKAWEAKNGKCANSGNGNAGNGNTDSNKASVADQLKSPIVVVPASLAVGFALTKFIA